MSFKEFKKRFNQLNGIGEIKVSGVYNDIEVNESEILFHRGGRKEVRKGSRVIKRSNKERIKLDELYNVYQNLSVITIESVKPIMKGFGSHAAPAVAFLKNVGLFGKEGRRLED